MKFIEDENFCYMKANTEFKGQEITLKLTVEDESNLEKTALEVLSSIEESWEDISNALLEELYLDYEDHYEGNDLLNKKEFLSSLPIFSIDYESYECEPCFTIYFGDGQLFGGHCIQSPVWVCCNTGCEKGCRVASSEW